MPRHLRHLRRAQKLCSRSNHPRFRLGALIALGSTVLGTGVNKLKTHPDQINPYTDEHGCSIHAELDAIKNSQKDTLFRATAYVARMKADGSYGLARPCKSCMKKLEEMGIFQVVYTTGEIEIPFQIERI